jgi:hypothetical protein
MPVDPKEKNNANDPYYARWSYERLLLLQPQIQVTGLWKKDDWFYAICPDLSNELRASDGSQLIQWFDHFGRAAGSPIRLAAQQPQGATLVPERTPDEVATLVGHPLTVRDMFTQLAMVLPKTFPDFDFNTSPPKAFVYVPRPLSQDEEECLRGVFSRYGLALHIEIIVDKERFESPKAFRYGIQGDIDLIAGRCLPKSMGHDLKLAWEGDEDFWVENRKRVLASGLQVAHQVLPESFRARSSCCLVNAMGFPPRNMRTYITLYRRVIIVMPLSSRYPDALNALRVAENDLIELATRGRLQFVLPQSLDRYPMSLLEQLASISTGF